MGEAIICRRGTNKGDGGGLKLDIVGGTTEPANPRENMIWVKTSSPITQWSMNKMGTAFQDVDGAVNLICSTDTDYTTESNTALCFDAKSNGIDGKLWVDLAGCNQSNGTNFKAVEGFVRKGETWVRFAPKQIYYYGNQMTETTGGWVNNSVSTDSPVFNDKSVTIAFTRPASTYHRICSMRTANTVAIPSYATYLCATVTSISVDNAKLVLAIGSGNLESSAVEAYATTTSTGIFKLDVSKFRGTNKKFILGSGTSGYGFGVSDAYSSISATVSKIWFE